MSKKYHLSGSDVGSVPIINKLRKSGVNINIGHSANNITNQDLVVYSSAIKNDNIEKFTIKNFSQITGITRNLSVEILEYFDKKGFTKRLVEKYTPLLGG